VYLIDQHVRRLDTNAEDSRNQANHYTPAFLLDCADLFAHYT